MIIELPESEAVIERQGESTTYKLRAKPITSARKAPDEQQLRDTFQTPSYAIDLLIPFIPKNISSIWEPAAGGRKISRQLENAGYTVFSSDIEEKADVYKYNFITGTAPPVDLTTGQISIITNPPFSIKDLFIEKCFDYGVPFAMLINADYSQKTIDWIRRGCEKIVPTSRIAYVTPNILSRIHEGEIWKILEDKKDCSTLIEYKKNYMPIWIVDLYVHHDVHNYVSIEECPNDLLYRYSNAQFHSMWLCYKFGLGKTETFVDLSVEQRRNI